jgi:hypothetical protein
VPGEQVPSPLQELQEPQELQPQLAEQVRDRVRVPQLPQASVWVSTAPGAHAPSPPQLPQEPQAGQAQLPVQVRDRA